MSSPYIPDPDYKLPEDDITMSDAIQEVFCSDRDVYDDRLDYTTPQIEVFNPELH